MLEFYYEGITREGEKIKGYIEAENETDLRIKLRSKKIRPLKINEKTKLLKNKKIKSLPKKLKNNEKTIFIKEFLLMIKSDLTIVQALEVLSSDGPTIAVMEISASIINYMESGMTFSQAISRFPNYFDNMFLNIIASGEIRGNLSEVIEHWLNYSEEESKLNKIINKTISYPLIISGIFFLSFLIITIGITPVFEKIYRAYNLKLPTVLLTLSTIGDILTYNLNFIILATLVALTALYYLLNKQSRVVSSFLLETPIISGFYKKVYSLKSIYMLQTILKCNITLSRALELASERISNYKYELVLLKASEASRKKENIASIFEQSKLFRTMSSQIISIGETMNKLPEMLEELKTFSFNELNNICNKISSIIEPLFLLSGGIIIGSILMSYFIPIIKIIESIK